MLMSLSLSQSLTEKLGTFKRLCMSFFVTDEIFAIANFRKDYYEIIAGERRWRAAKMAGLKEVPVIVKDYTDLETAETLIRYNVFEDPVLNEVIRKDTFERLRKVIRDLDDESRWLIELHYYQERSLTATAEFFGISKQALSKRHAELLKKMRKSMET